MTEHPHLTARLRATLKSARAVLQSPSLCPQIRLFLLNEDFPRTPLSREEQLAVSEHTAYWAFCWPAGQILAQHIETYPSLVAAKTVVDLGCGSGIVALAAARAGAARVIACDHDPDALLATKINAEVNEVRVELCSCWDPHEKVDLVLLADVLYDRLNYPLLDWLRPRTRSILASDSRMLALPPEIETSGWTDLGRRSSTLVPDLDWNDDFRWVQLFHWRETEH